MKALGILLTLLAILALPLTAPAQEGDSARPSPSTRASDERRRDPFVSIVIKREEGAAAPTRLPPGKPGLVIGQLQLLGTVQSIDGDWIAVVDNKTNRAYFLRQNDQVYNGSVSRITEDSVVFLENVTGSAGERRTREVVKRLAP